jgi:hypothetical protein
LIFLPGLEKEQANPNTDSAVSQVKGRKSGLASVALVHVEVEKIDNVLAAFEQAIGQIADNTPKEQSESDLPEDGARAEVAPAPVEDHQGHGGNECQQPVMIFEGTPGGSGITPMDQPEKAVNHHPFVAEPKEFNDRKFAELIEDENGEGDNPHA